MFDVAIIGAGPAGTSAAFDLLEKGLRVLILDKYEFPRKKACAGGITPKGYHLFRYDISSMVTRECNTIKINPANNKPFYIKDPDTLCYMTKREDLDFFSLNKVIEKGADFRVIKGVQSITESSSGVQIKTGSGSFKASYLIGADGANSIVRRLTTKKHFYKKQFGIEADIKIDDPGKYSMEFDFSKSKNCYYWVFPKDDHVNIGIYSIDNKVNLRRQQLVEYANARSISGYLEAFKGYPICTGGLNYRPDKWSGERLGSQRILLAGDAAGLSERLLGEGIYFAVKSGQLAAKVIWENEKYPNLVVTNYSKALEKLKTDLKYHELSSQIFYRFPRASLKILSVPFIHKHFARGYSKGKTITRILYNKSV
jgi:geranylgeranyl reductase family protein